MSVLLSALYMVFCGFVWRLRGGAWATLLHIHMGTTVTRLVSSLLISVPLAVYWGLWSLIPLITIGMWLGLVLAGYGPFMGMGSHAFPPARTWIEFFPRLLGLAPQSVGWDTAGMWFCGVLLYLPVVLGYCWLASNWLLLLGVPLAAAAFAGSYLIMSKVPKDRLPIWPGFTAREHEVFGEIFTGFATGLVLIVLTLCV